MRPVSMYAADLGTFSTHTRDYTHDRCRWAGSGSRGVPFGKLRAGFRLRSCFAMRSGYSAQEDNLIG